ncbi:SDR family oxidoreductase [Kineococcus rhizosphaerae]|uniref:NADP-dependent 3-hydroxy acid dehydrogenase YdfG n=1 Tax=Kineococcus rhizosphaerae TaxID=559628 RepID=A0A2T0RAX4_9ACTN|nr:SDR family oxidoreductase [Kineococcus rhizosphaerae]PRY18314.1 NADP-dependent 3-hydroxy acid dehydrogenase YdfG [Kineococcus rhizosphaerae]
MRDLTGKVAFVTGGASGIGLGIVEALVDRGVSVMIADLRQDHLDEAAARFEGTTTVATVAVDVIDRDGMAAAAQRTLEVFGRCDIVVNNAGVGANPSVDEVTYADWDWVLSVNLGGTVNGIMSFLPTLLAQGEGHIVNTASMAGILPTANNYIYAASKYAVRGLSESLRLTLAPRGIGVSVVFPGLTQSRMLQSEQNRQAQFRSEVPTSRPEGGPVAPPPNSGMHPRELGEIVVRGILDNQANILTHSEFRGELEEHFASVIASFPPPQEIDPGRLMLEEARRAETAAAQRAVDALTTRS